MEENLLQILIAILGSLFTIEVIPIKVNPLTSIFNWISKRINFEIKEELNLIKKNQERQENEFLEFKADYLRWEIFAFENSIRRGRKHTEEEFVHVIEQCIFYEKFCEKYDIQNGKAKHAIAHIKESYDKCITENSFL